MRKLFSNIFAKHSKTPKIMRKHKKLRAFALADELVIEIYKINYRIKLSNSQLINKLNLVKLIR